MPRTRPKAELYAVVVRRGSRSPVTRAPHVVRWSHACAPPVPSTVTMHRGCRYDRAACDENKFTLRVRITDRNSLRAMESYRSSTTGILHSRTIAVVVEPMIKLRMRE